MFDAVRQPVRAAQRLGHQSLEAAQTFTNQTSTNETFTNQTSTTGTSQSFARNEKGNVAIIFALTAAVSCFLVGGAVDLGRAYSMRTQMQNAVDSASLAAGSAYVNDPNHDATKARDIGERYYAAAMIKAAGNPLVTGYSPATVTITPFSQSATVNASLTVKTPFLWAATSVLPGGSASFQQITLSTSSVSTATQTTGSGSNNVELTMMLDTTGSMGADDGTGMTKIQRLINSATSFVNILLPDNSTPHVKIALAPFTQTVKVNDTWAQTMTGQPLTKQITDANVCGQTCVNTTCASFRRDGSCRTWNQSCTPNTCTGHLSRCMIGRTGTEAAKDTSPTTGNFAQWPATWVRDVNTVNTCLPNQTVVPLTSVKAGLLNTISQFQAAGWTSGSLGINMAWNLISPNFNASNLLTGGTGPTGSSPVAYNTTGVKKIAVLMTDGEFNCQNYNIPGNFCGDQNTAVVSARAIAQCTAMKAQGIEVYTVGFKLDVQIAIDTLSACATDANHFFNATDGNLLAAAFQTIAYRSVPLHVQQ